MKKKTKNNKGSAIERNENSTLYTREQTRGQITAEFVITLIILFSLFSVVVFISIEQKENFNLTEKKIKAKTLMEKTARAVNGIHLAGNGSITKIKKEFDFELKFEENTLMAYFGKGQFVSTSLTTKNIRHSLKTANPNTIEIKNNNGVIEIEEQ